MQQGDLFDWRASEPAAADASGTAQDKTAACALRAHLDGTVQLTLGRLVDVVRMVAAAPAAADHAELLGAVCRRYGAGDATFGPYPEVTAAIEGLAALPADRRRPILAALVRGRAVDPHRLPAHMRAEWAALSPDWERDLRACLYDGSPAIKRAACRVVADYDLRRLTPALDDLLQDTAPRVPAAAAIALGQLGAPAARPYLEGIVKAAIDGRTPPFPLGDILEALLPVATGDSVVIVRRAARQLEGADRATAEAALADLTAV